MKPIQFSPVYIWTISPQLKAAFHLQLYQSLLASLSRFEELQEGFNT